MKEVSIESIINQFNQLNIIDIRDNYLYNLGHIPNAKNIPLNYLKHNPDYYINKNEIYYIYCNCGISSKELANYLLLKGYNIVNIIGGYRAYQKIINSHQ